MDLGREPEDPVEVSIRKRWRDALPDCLMYVVGALPLLCFVWVARSFPRQPSWIFIFLCSLSGIVAGIFWNRKRGGRLRNALFSTAICCFTVLFINEYSGKYQVGIGELLAIISGLIAYGVYLCILGFVTSKVCIVGLTAAKRVGDFSFRGFTRRSSDFAPPSAGALSLTTPSDAEGCLSLDREQGRLSLD